jgi:hypothetical protein
MVLAVYHSRPILMLRRIQGQRFLYQHILTAGSQGDSVISLGRTIFYFLVAHVGIATQITLFIWAAYLLQLLCSVVYMATGVQSAKNTRLADLAAYNW